MNRGKIEVTEGTDKAGWEDRVWRDREMSFSEFHSHGAMHHVTLHHTAQCCPRDRKTMERRPQSQEMSRAKKNKTKVV